MNTNTSANSDELTPAGRLVHLFRDSLGREPDEDAYAAVEELFPTGDARVEFIFRFSALIVLSSSIAAFGLLADSAAVVIGAMLVAPLMTPILATASATVRAENRELVIALSIIALGTVLAILVGYATSAIASDAIGTTELPKEVRARTFPGLLDLGIAITAGAAAGYILPRRAATSALPGVGIAVALIPPLATIGITYELGARTDSSNALLLYLTNLAAIVFAASIMLVLAGFRPRTRVSRKMLAARVLVTLTAVAAVAVPLTFHTLSTVEDTRLRRTVADAVVAWDGAARVVELNADATDGRARVNILIAGPNTPREVWTLAEQIRDDFGGPVELDMQYQQDLRFRVSTR